MSTGPWSLHVLSEVLAAFTVESPSALRDVLSRVSEAVDAEVTAILSDGNYVLCTGLDEDEKNLLHASSAGRPQDLSCRAGALHLYWTSLGGAEWLVVGRFQEIFSMEERALLRAMGRSIELCSRVLAAVQAERQARQAEQRAKEVAIREATIDQLTGLANRRLVIRYLGERLSLSFLESNSTAVLYIDLDRFKHINDVYGHRAGDQYLCAVGHALRAFVGPFDLVGRLAGDEFIVITTASDLAEVCVLAQRILDRFAKPFEVMGRFLLYTVSIGIAIAGESETPESLMENADLAMYAAKQQGPGVYVCFDRLMREQRRNKALIEMELRAALRAGEIVAYFQPVVAAVHGGVVGFEALARWRHPQRGWLEPDHFIPIAEEAGLLRDVDEAVLRDACHSLGQWRSVKRGICPRLSVNISAPSLSDILLAQRVRSVLAESGLEIGSLFLEITETSLVEDVAASVQNFAELESIGVRLAIDDFGIGYSSLRYLRRFPVEVLKIDKSFVWGLGRNRDDEVIVETVIRMAHSMGIKVVAEGVEIQEQADFLLGLGCDFLQGYLYGRPAPPSRSEALFEQSVASLLGVGLEMI